MLTNFEERLWHKDSLSEKPCPQKNSKEEKKRNIHNIQSPAKNANHCDKFSACMCTLLKGRKPSNEARNKNIHELVWIFANSYSAHYDGDAGTNEASRFIIFSNIYDDAPLDCLVLEHFENNVLWSWMSYHRLFVFFPLARSSFRPQPRYAAACQYLSYRQYFKILMDVNSRFMFYFSPPANAKANSDRHAGQ